MSKGLVYLILMIDQFKIVLVILITIYFLYNLLYLLFLLKLNEEKKEQKEISLIILMNEEIFLKIKKIFIPFVICLVLLILISFIPSTKQAVIIYLIPKITNNKEISKIPNYILELFNEEIKDLIKNKDN